MAVHDCGVVTGDSGALPTGSPWLAMDLAPRGDLIRHPVGANWLALRRALMGLLSALAHAHARGVIHRDLKPANVLVGRGGQLILTDFGIARVGRERADDANSVSGTPRYMAPEQIRGQWRDLGPWTDLYSLGCMVHELASGTAPFDGPTPLAVATKQLTAEAPPLVPRFPVPDGFESWLSRLLAKDFNERFACAADAAWRLGLLEDVEGVGDQIALGEAMTEALTLSTLVDAPRRFDQAENTAAPTADPPPFAADWRHATPHRKSLVGVGMGLFGLRVPPLFGLEPERDQLWSALAKVHATGATHAVVVEAAEGTGKTRLAQWLAWRATELGAAEVHRIEHGPVRDVSSGVSGALRNAFAAHGMDAGALAARVRGLLQRIDPDADAEDLEQDVPALTCLMMPQAAGAGRPVLTPAERFASVTRWIGRAARRRPVIVWIDDAQWGAETVGFARHLLTHDAGPVLLVICAQTCTPGLEGLVEAGAEHLVLAPLGRAEQAKLVRAQLGLAPNTVERLLNHAAGRPRFIQHLLANWIERDELVVEPRGLSAPESAWPREESHVVTQRVERHMCALNLPDVRLTAYVAAALGRAVEQTIWARACDHLGVEARVAVADTLAHCGLVKVGASGFAFTDRGARRALLEAARSDPRWPAINGACAAALADRPDLRANRATHLLAAGDRDAALQTLEAATKDSLAAGDYEATLALVERHQGLALTLPAHDRRRAVTLPMQADALRFLGRNDALSAVVEKLDAWLQRADDLRLRQALARVRGATGFATGQFHDHHAHYREAAQLAESMDDPEVLAEAVHGTAWGNLLLGHNAEAQALFERCREIAEAHGLHDQAAWALHGLAAARTYALDASGREPARAAERYFRERGSARGRANALFFVGEGERLAARYPEARAALTQARELWRSIGSAFGSFGDLALANLALDTGDLRAAEHGFLTLIEQIGLSSADAPKPHIGLATIAAERGDTAAFDEAFGTYVSLLAGPHTQHPAHQMYPVRCAERWQAAGDTGRAAWAWRVAARNWAKLDPQRAGVFTRSADALDSTD